MIIKVTVVLCIIRSTLTSTIKDIYFLHTYIYIGCKTRTNVRQTPEIQEPEHLITPSEAECRETKLK